MPEEDNKILKYNHGQKSMMQPFAIYFDFESLLEKIHTYPTDLEKSSTTKINKHIPSNYHCLHVVYLLFTCCLFVIYMLFICCLHVVYMLFICCLHVVYLLFTCCLFDPKENKLDSYTGKDCMKKFCENLRERVLRIINYEKKKIISLTKEKRRAHRWAKICYICKKEVIIDNDDKKKYKVKDHRHYTGKYRWAALYHICNLRYKTIREISVIAHNASTYDYHLIIKELAKEFEGSFECLGENTEEYMTFSVPIEKQRDNGKMITYKIRFKDSYRFMSSSLSKPVDNLGDINCKICDNRREYIGFRNNHLLLECSNCNAWFKRDSKELIKRFANTYEFCNKDINKFILLLRKGVYPYEYMDNWERFNEVVLPDKKAFYSNLNIESTTDVDYRHANSVFKEFKMINLGDYRDLYVKSDTVLLADVFENFRNMCMKIYEPDPSHFLTAPGLAWQACLKKNRSRIRINN